MVALPSACHRDYLMLASAKSSANTSLQPIEQVDPTWAWSAYEPSSDHPWTHELASHLFRRAGFCATWRQLDDSVRAGPRATVDGLLAGGDATAFYADADRTAASLLVSNNPQNLPA